MNYKEFFLARFYTLLTEWAMLNATPALGLLTGVGPATGVGASIFSVRIR